jgi:hypothetical protein
MRGMLRLAFVSGQKRSRRPQVSEITAARRSTSDSENHVLGEAEMAISVFCSFPVRQMRMGLNGEGHADLALLQFQLHTLNDR